MSKNYYYIEGTTENDYIGFDSYIETLNTVIDNGSNFIGLISEFGTGKSSLIKMLKGKDNRKNKFDFVTINLWNCDDKNKKRNLDIHRVFLHQLIDGLKIDSKEYYKKKLDKKYRLFDLVFGFKRKIYAFCLFFTFLMFVLDQIEVISLFSSQLQKIFCYSLLVSLFLLCIILYKPLLSFDKDKSTTTIDENDTRDLYSSIIEKYFSYLRNKKKKLIICLEELDRYSDYNVVLRYIKEFYKFYKINPNNVVFIISIKSANSLAGVNGQEITNEIKNSYEKVFDFILNLNQVNIQDYDSILLDLLKEKKDDLPQDVDLPDINDMDGWRYLYTGQNITIRDIKHRYNFAVSLYLSALESGVDHADFKKCLYISYLEDEHNVLYSKLIKNSNNINDLLLYYAKNKNLNGIIIEGITLNDNEKDIIINGIANGFINMDYVYYFFKFPKNKNPYNSYEIKLYNAVFFNNRSYDLSSILSEMSDEEVRNILSKRVDKNILPEIIFDYKRLIRLEYNNEYNTFMDTIYLKYDLISNYSSFEMFVKAFNDKDRVLFKRVIETYFTEKKSSIDALSPDEKKSLRIKLVKLFKSDSIYFKYLFDDNNDIITPEEIKAIVDLKIVNNLSNNKINEDYILALKSIIKYNTYKTNIINLLTNLSKNKLVTNEMYKDVFNTIDFKRITISDNDIKAIFKSSLERLDLGKCENLYSFIKKIDHYNLYLDDYYVSIIDSSNKEFVKNYINVIQTYHLISENGLKVIGECPTIFALNDELLDALYSHKYYYIYVVSKRLKDGQYEIEKDKEEVLHDFYIKEFTNRKEWTSKVTPEMIKFLYDNVDFDILSEKQLDVFNSCEQKAEIIKAVLKNPNFDFVNRYIAKIKNIKKKDRTEIFNLIYNYHINNRLNQNAKKNMKELAGRNSEERDLFDDRRKHK